MTEIKIAKKVPNLKEKIPALAIQLLVFSTLAIAIAVPFLAFS